jgi:hypothetical protein
MMGQRYRRTDADERKDHPDGRLFARIPPGAEGRDGEARSASRSASDRRSMAVVAVYTEKLRIDTGGPEEMCRLFFSEINKGATAANDRCAAIRMNPYLADILGMRPASLPGTSFWDKIAAFDRRIFSFLFRRTWQGIPSRGILRQLPAHGSPIPALIFLSLLTSGSTPQVGVLAVELSPAPSDDRFFPPPGGSQSLQTDPTPAGSGFFQSLPEKNPAEEKTESAVRRGLTPYWNRRAFLPEVPQLSSASSDPQRSGSPPGWNTGSNTDPGLPDPAVFRPETVYRALQCVLIFPPHLTAGKGMRFLQQPSAVERMGRGMTGRITQEELHRL